MYPGIIRRAGEGHCVFCCCVKQIKENAKILGKNIINIPQESAGIQFAISIFTRVAISSTNCILTADLPKYCVLYGKSSLQTPAPQQGPALCALWKVTPSKHHLPKALSPDLWYIHKMFVIINIFIPKFSSGGEFTPKVWKNK